MGQGNPNKVNAIVDEIVKNNNLFKLKSPIEQDKEKDSMARSINSALSELNEFGRELVLQDLSVDPDEKFKGFIDSVGNVDISGLTQMTTTIVKAKIEEAEREGIDLRQGQPVFKDNTKILLVEGVLTAAVIDTMIKDFDKLSSKEKNTLADNWLNMTNSQKFAYSEALGENLLKGADSISDKDIRDKVKQIGIEAKGCEEEFESAKKAFQNMTIEEKIARIKEMIPDITILPSNWRENLEETWENAWMQQASESIKLKTQLSIELKKLDELKKNGATPEIINANERKVGDLATQLHNDGLEKKFFSLPIKVRRDITIQQFREMSNDEKEKFLNRVNPNEIQSIVETKRLELNALSIKTKQEIEQLPIALAKAGFSQDEIKETLKIYIGTLKSLENDDIEKYKSLISNEVQHEIKEFLIEDGISSKIAGILSRIDYNGNLLDILSNEDMIQIKVKMKQIKIMMKDL